MDTTAVNHLFSKLAEGIAGAAEALEVPAQEVWRVYVTQSYAMGIAELVVSLFCAVGVGVMVKLALWCKEGYCAVERERYSSAGDGWVVGGVLGTASAIFLYIPTILCLHDGLLYLINPEFYAIERLLAHL